MGHVARPDSWRRERARNDWGFLDKICCRLLLWKQVAGASGVLNIYRILKHVRTLAILQNMQNAPMLASIRAATFQWRAGIRHRRRRRRRWTTAPWE